MQVRRGVPARWKVCMLSVVGGKGTMETLVCMLENGHAVIRRAHFRVGGYSDVRV
jgi:hypothetical protein